MPTRKLKPDTPSHRYMSVSTFEEITKKTLEGEKIQYLVQPAVPKARTVQLESIKGRIFLTSEEAKQALIENATRAIDAMIEKTQSLVNRIFFAKQQRTIDNPDIVQVASKTQQEKPLKTGYQWVVMEDGNRVQVKIPEILK